MVQWLESRSLLERSCVRFPSSLLNQIKKQLCYDQFGEGIKYIHTQPTSSLIKKSSIYFNVFLIRYELRIKNRIQTDIWDKLSFKIHIIKLFSWFYFVKDRRCFTNHLAYPTDIIMILQGCTIMFLLVDYVLRNDSCYALKRRQPAYVNRTRCKQTNKSNLIEYVLYNYQCFFKYIILTKKVGF